MKSKASLAVLLVEIIAIVAMHTARSSKPEAEKPAVTRTPSINHYADSDIKQPVLFTTLR